MSDRSAVTAVVVAYNGGAALVECVRSLLSQTIANELTVMIVDNASTDGSIDVVEREFGPHLAVVRRATNGGYAAGANTGWRAARSDIVAVLNQDLVLMPDCLERMREALLRADREALVTPKLLLMSDPEKVNAIGNDVHLSGVAWCNGLGTLASAWDGIIEVPAVSGAAFLARRAFLEGLAGLEEGYFMYMEDVDLSARARLAGAVCLAACSASALHDWRLSLTPARFRQLERNRRVFWFRLWGGTYRMYPFLVQAEVMGWLYAALRGRQWMTAKYQAARDDLRLPPVRDALRLQPIFARKHPFAMLFPRSPLARRLGSICDSLFSLALRGRSAR